MLKQATIGPDLGGTSWFKPEWRVQAEHSTFMAGREHY